MLYFSSWKIGLILAVLAIGALFAAPNLVSEQARIETVVTADGEEEVGKGIWRFLPRNALNLGLDLQGGSYLLLEVDTDGVEAKRLDDALTDARTLLEDEGIGAESFGVVDNHVTLRVTDLAQKEAAMRALRTMSRPLDAAAIGGGRTLQIVDEPGAEIHVRVTPEYLAQIRAQTMSASVEAIRRRIDGTGVSEPTIQRQGDRRILVQAPGVSDPERLKRQIGKTAQMSFHLVVSQDPEEIRRVAETGRLSPLRSLLPEEFAFIAPPDAENAGEEVDSNDKEYWDQCLTQRRCLIVNRRANVSGDNLRNASQGFHPERGDPIVNFSFDLDGSKEFCRLTNEHEGERFATVLDGVIITAPRINSPICGGSGFIEGNFTIDGASDLAALLNAGRLPAELTIVEERTVGAELGADSVNAGRTALIIGFIGVIIFMIMAYGIFGIFANLALAANVILIAGALSGLGATLTLPGIAGIILTIGMAVDANVLIYERIHEERAAGRSASNAVEAGYQRALSAILDANITTLIAAAVLYFFGSGPVRGFAVTLGIGIFTSVFTAFVVSRFLVAQWFRTVRPRTLPI